MEENKKDVLPLEGEPLTAPQISEPVVNALAAALSKIETYVPTQYIDDGPPDIDADHLNHAEQAIMRVTNLANGAADAIAALQSQVTQLNNNILGEPAPYNTDLNTMTKGGVWMVQTDEDKIEQNNFPQGVVNGWVRVYRNSNGATKQVFYRYGTNDKTDGYVYTRTYNVNSKNWSRWTSYARMSDLGDLITHRKTTGNTSDSGNITINRPEGYSLIGAYINSVYVRLSIPTVYQKTIIVRCFDENMSPLKNTLVEVISLWIKKDISY